MKNPFTPKHLRVLAARDVDRVRRYAHIVLEITPEGVVERINPHFGIGVIAVIGPGQASGVQLSCAVLCEVGLGQSRPYHPCRVPRRERKRLGLLWLPHRRQWCALTENQYGAVAGRIFEILQRSADERVSRWKTGRPDNPWYVKGRNHYFTVGRGWDASSNSNVICIRGGRFSISLEDRFFIRDIYWAELHSSSLKTRLRGIAQFIDKCFKGYRRKGRKRGYRRSFQKLEYVKRVREMLMGQRDGWLPPYQMMHILDHLPEGKENPLYTEVAEFIAAVAGGEGTPFPQELAAQAALAHPAKRLKGIELRVVPRRGQRDHVVFEVFPSEQKGMF